jgi:Ca-activated chloride channel family protein
VRVEDFERRPVNNLRREDFRVFEDGVAQSVSFFSTEEAPVSYGLVVCYTGVERAQVEKVVEAGKLLVASNRPGDATFIARFMSGGRAQIQWNFTTDKRALGEALDALYTGAAPRTLVDAVYLSAEHVAQNDAGDARSAAGAGGVAPASRPALRRRALVLVTDGEDRGSFYKQEQLFGLLRREDVQIYVIGFVGELKTRSDGGRRSERARAVTLLNRLAAETGGRVFYPNSLRDLPLVAGEVARDLRTHYTIGYRPTNTTRDGSFRSLRVTVSDADDGGKRSAVTRSGYTR